MNTNTESTSPVVDMGPVLQDRDNEEGEATVFRLVGNGIQFLQAQGWSKDDLMNYMALTAGKEGVPTTTQTKSDLPRSATMSAESSTMNGSSENNSSTEGSEFKDDRVHINDGAYFTAAYFSLMVSLIALWWYTSIKLSIEDGYWYRCGFFVLSPLLLAMGMLPFRILIYNPLVLLGSWRNILKNSTYHSAIASPPPKILPDVCIQMPVYKEAFDQTIYPSLEDIDVAIQHYRSCGGKAYMFVNDDGLQLLDDEERDERLNYYHENDIAYIARPDHKTLARHGLFKKASNMNFALNFALELAQVEQEAQGALTKAEAIQKVIDSRPYPILAGGPIDMASVGNILLVDSDTRVPESCLINTVGEFAISPNVGFIQHLISVLRVDDNYWEDMLAHFTTMLYAIYIPTGTACGEPAPLVGHNATLNWKAVQEVSWFDEEVGYRKFWSESHVSEDFDLSLRLQAHGYIGRYAMYTGDGFKEGVSVTVHDEIKKMKKFAFGSGEMLFNPIPDMWRKGVCCDLIKDYLTQSGIPWHARLNLLGYLSSYIAMAFGVLTVPYAFYLAAMDAKEMGMLTAWEIMIGTTIAFGLVGLGCVIIMSVLLEHESNLFTSAVKNVKLTTTFGFFFMGIQYHIFTSLARYTFKMKAEWGATVKEIDDADYSLKTLFGELYQTFLAYWDMYLVGLGLCGFAVYIFIFGPVWITWSNFAMSPFVALLTTQVLMPIIMNPTAMRCIYMPPYQLFMWCLGCTNIRTVEDNDEITGDLENPPSQVEQNLSLPVPVLAPIPVAPSSPQLEASTDTAVASGKLSSSPLIDFATPDQKPGPGTGLPPSDDCDDDDDSVISVALSI